MSKKKIVALAVAVGLFGSVAVLEELFEGDVAVVTNAVVAWCFAAAGAIAWLRRPDHSTGRLLLLTGALWSVRRFATFEEIPLVWTAGELMAFLWVLPLAYLVLTFPGPRLVTAKNKVLFSIVTVLVTVNQSIGIMSADDYGGRNLVHIDALRGIHTENELIVDIIALALLLIFSADVRRKWRQTTRVARRAFGPVVLGGFGTLAFLVVIDMFRDFLPWFSELPPAVYQWLDAGFGAVPFAFLAGVLRAYTRRARLGDLVMELGDLPSPDALQGSLRKTLDDPSLVAAIWVPEAQRYEAPDGAALEMPDEDAERVVTFLERHGEPLAAIVHDRALLDDPRLVESVKAAVRLAVENERLQDEVLTQLAEVRASRARIVEASDAERQRIERNLHDGAQQRLVSLSYSLRLIASKLGPEVDEEVRRSLDATTREVQDALAELRDLARGIHPAVLTEEGLGPALESLAERIPVAVELTQLPEGRLPQPVEAAGYYVASEALSNVAKHAEASVAHLAADVRDGSLRIEVSDDGVGGAAVESGTGLRGLADRVQALDGTLNVVSPPGKGTTVVAEIPVREPREQEAAPTPAVPMLVRERLTAPQQARAEPAARPLLACRGIAVAYEGKQALAGVDLDIAPGELVTLLGTNGAGKSTLLRVIAGLTEPGDGMVLFDGRDITYYPTEVRARSGLIYVPGGKGAFGPLSVIDNLRLFANGHKKKDVEARLERVFEAFPVLASRRSETASRLSRGQQQMLALAKTQMVEARLLLIDELTLGLAPAIAEQLLGMVTKINDDGVAVLFVDQSAERALSIARRAYFLDAGRVAFSGAPEELRRRDDLLRAVFVHEAAKVLARA